MEINEQQLFDNISGRDLDISVDFENPDWFPLPCPYQNFLVMISCPVGKLTFDERHPFCSVQD